MSIFKRSDKSKVQPANAVLQTDAKAAKAETKAKSFAPLVVEGPVPRAAIAPGVVPPPAAPIYSTQLPATVPRAKPSAKVSVVKRPTQNVAMTASRAGRLQRLQPAQAAQAAQAPQQAQSFDPVRCAQAGLLHLAWSWQHAGSPIRAIHAYMELLSRWPDSAAADAAVADLAELSDKLATEGQFHTALAIYDQLGEII